MVAFLALNISLECIEHLVALHEGIGGVQFGQLSDDKVFIVYEVVVLVLVEAAACHHEEHEALFPAFVVEDLLSGDILRLHDGIFRLGGEFPIGDHLAEVESLDSNGELGELILVEASDEVVVGLDVGLDPVQSLLHHRQVLDIADISQQVLFAP